MPLIAIGVLALAQAFDYLTFLLMTARHGLDVELNPFVVRVATELGLSSAAITSTAVWCELMALS